MARPRSRRVAAAASFGKRRGHNNKSSSYLLTASRPLCIIPARAISLSWWALDSSWWSPRHHDVFTSSCLRSMGSATGVSNTDNNTKTNKILYLHVGPSGDCWIGDSIFAAKHLQPDYVKSVPLLLHNVQTENDDEMQQQKIDKLLEALEDNPELAMEIYDSGKIPADLLERIFRKDQNEED